MTYQYLSLRKLDAEVVTMLRAGELTLGEAAYLTGCSKTACHNAKVGLTWKNHPSPPVPAIKQIKKFKRKLKR